MPFPNLSAIDRLLVELLQNDARMTNKDLAKAAGIAQSTCLERVRQLQRQGVIRGWHADVDPAALGRTIRALVSVRLAPKTTSSVRSFFTDVLAAPEVLSVATVTGANDFVVDVAVPDVDHLRHFVLDVITSRPDVADTQTALVYEYARKTVLEPMGVDETPPARASRR